MCFLDPVILQIFKENRKLNKDHNNPSIINQNVKKNFFKIYQSQRNSKMKEF